MYQIVRTAHSEYELRDEDGVIRAYNQTAMTHPKDWKKDVPESVGPDDWSFIDERTEQS